VKNIPVELSGHKARVVEAPTMKTREKNGQTEVVTGFNDETLFVVGLFIKPLPNEQGRAGKGSEVRATLETDPGDEIQEGDLVELINPRVSHWEMTTEDGKTISGLSWRATGIKPVG
jgi:hypothetical protein